MDTEKDKSAELINQQWQPLPGTRRAEIYPYIRKPDLLSSNSCLIRTPEQILLIDPGAQPAQTADLNRVLAACQQERARPLLIFLTHCHIDHTLQACRCQQAQTLSPAWIVSQEEGADILARGDAQCTIASLYGQPFPAFHTDIRLLTAQDRRRGGLRRIRLTAETSLSIETSLFPPGQDLKPFARQSLAIGGGERLEVYPAPGHSPDSLYLRIGHLLFIGDILSAANPMVAGIAGWNRADLLQTLEQALRIMETLPIHLCVPGHGPPIPAWKVADLLKRLRDKTRHMGDVTAMNEHRLFQATEFALELIDEAEEIFTSIAGRLLFVAYHLEELGEEETARRCRAAMDMDAIDNCLDSFRRLCQALEKGEKRQVEFANGALSIVEKIRRLFDPSTLTPILPPSLVNRASTLLLDFIGVAQGMRNMEEFIPTDLNALVVGVIDAWRTNPHQDPSIVDDADDEALFLAGLIRRIGSAPAVDRPPLLFRPGPDLPLVHLAPGRLADTLTHFLEELALTDPPSVDLASGLDEKGLFLRITPHSRDDLSSQREIRKQRAFTRRFRLCGLTLTRDGAGFRLQKAQDEA